MIDGPRRSRGATWYPLAAGAIVAAIALAAITAVPVGVFWDDGVYLIGAKSLATGAGYRFLHLPGAPPAVHFPPGWPAVLAVVWRLGPAFPGNVVLLKLVNPLLLAAGAALACWYGVNRLRVPPLVAAAAAVVFAAALPVMVMAGVLFSEPLFFVVLLIALALADRAADRGGWRPALEAGVAAGILALVRSAGLTLLPALVIALLLARRRRARRWSPRPVRSRCSPRGSSGSRCARTTSPRRSAEATVPISIGCSACTASAGRRSSWSWRA